MRLGIGSYTYGWAVAAGALSAADLIDRARAFGVGVVQLCDNLPPATFEPETLAELRQRADAAGIALELGTRGAAVPHLRRLIDAARRAGSRILRLVIDADGDRPDEAEIIKRLQSLHADLDASGVTLAIENHDRLPAASLAGVIRALDSPRVGICLDTANSFGALEGPDVVFPTLAPFVVNLHLKDFAVERLPHQQGFVIEGRPLGRGRLDLPRLLATLRAHGRDPNAILELWTPPESTPEATIAAEARNVQESLHAARRFIPN